MFFTSEFGDNLMGLKTAQATETLPEKPTIKAVKADHTPPPSPLCLNSPFFRECIPVQGIYLLEHEGS